MEISISIEELRKRKLFIATPMYGGMAHGLYVKSCLDLQTTMSRYGIEKKRFIYIFKNFRIWSCCLTQFLLKFFFGSIPVQKIKIM